MKYTLSSFLRGSDQPASAPGAQYAILLILLSAAAFWNAPELPEQIDDLPALRDAELMQEKPEIFYSGHHHRTGRPAGHIVRYGVYLLFGPSQKSFHLFSIATHTGIAFLVALLAFKLNAAAPRWAGVLFLLNVAHFKAVYHLAALEYLLAAAFSICACILLWERDWLQDRPWRTSLLYLCILGGVASHIASWSMWPVFIALMWHKRYSYKFALLIAVPLLLINASFSAHALAQLHSDGVTTTHRSLSHLESGGGLSVTTARMYAWFVAYVFLFSHAAIWPVWEAFPWQVALGGLLIPFGLWAMYKRRADAMGFCLLWIACTLIPFAVQTEDTIRFVPGPSRYLYLATVASSILIAQGLFFLRRFRYSAIWWPLMTAALLVSSLYYLHKVEALSWYTGSALVRSQGDLVRANRLMRTAIDHGLSLLPGEEAFMRLILMRVIEDPERSFVEAEEALERFPVSARIKAVHLALRAHLDPTALESLRSNKHRPLAAGMLYNLGRGYFQQKDYALAQRAAAASLVLEPNKTASLDFLGSLLVQLQQVDEGLSLLEKSAAIKGDSSVYHMVLRSTRPRAD